MKYEEIIKQLDEISTKLESEEIELSKALELFEKSVKLSKEGFGLLSDTAGKITMLKKELDKYIEKPFE